MGPYFNLLMIISVLARCALKTFSRARTMHVLPTWAICSYPQYECVSVCVSFSPPIQNEDAHHFMSGEFVLFISSVVLASAIKSPPNRWESNYRLLFVMLPLCVHPIFFFTLKQQTQTHNHINHRRRKSYAEERRKKTSTIISMLFCVEQC